MTVGRMVTKCPRLVIAGLSGDAGKTITSLSFLTALRRRGLSLSVFKKGPDYIDAAWLAWAAQTECRNLDTYMVTPDTVAASFAEATTGSDLALIEGNRGLLDGRDATGTHSTASLARLLKAPVVVVVNCTKVTRTVAAMVKGCQVLEPELKLAGVILNRVAGKRHRRVITEAIEQTCGLPVLGAIPKLDDGSTLIPGRHLGLVTPSEFGEDTGLRERLISIAEDYLDIDRLIEIAGDTESLTVTERPKITPIKSRVRVGYFCDSVFTFYYPENLAALQSRGAELVPVSSLEDESLPEIDSLYIGGGFPETQAEKLSHNLSMLQSVRKAAKSGLPIYAECGGLIFLCRSLTCDNQRYDLAGIFNFDLQMHSKPVGHGYTEIVVDRANPYFEIGTVIRGHEFHYTGPSIEPVNTDGCMQVRTGVGLGNKREGLIYKNCLACYTHLHADGLPEWADAFVSQANDFRMRTSRPEADCQSQLEKTNVMEVFRRPGVEAGVLALGG